MWTFFDYSAGSTESEVDIRDVSSFPVTTAPASVALSCASVILSYVFGPSFSGPFNTNAFPSFSEVMSYVAGPSIAGLSIAVEPVSSTHDCEPSSGSDLASVCRSLVSISSVSLPNSHSFEAGVLVGSFPAGTEDVHLLDAAGPVSHLTIAKHHHDSTWKELSPTPAKLNKDREEKDALRSALPLYHSLSRELYSTLLVVMSRFESMIAQFPSANYLNFLIFFLSWETVFGFNFFLFRMPAVVVFLLGESLVSSGSSRLKKCFSFLLSFVL